MNKLAETAARIAKTTPGLRRLRASPAAETIRAAVLDDQERGRAAARIAAEKADAIDIPNVLGMAAQDAKDGHSPAAASKAPAIAKRPPAARPKRIRAAIVPTPVPVPTERMAGMSRAHAAKYMLAATGTLPTAPDFSKPSYAPDRKRLAELVKLMDAGDAAGLRAYAIRVFYSGAQALDRYRHRAILAIEARAQQAQAA